ncbi:MAG: DUF1285 domain-containing protein [Stellaceae bacterium]
MGAVEIKQTVPSPNTSADASLTENSNSRNSSLVLPPKRVRRPVIDHGDLEMRIARDGVWYYRGSPIRRPALVNLFAAVLRRESDGSYWLITPAERGRIEVEDAPFLAVALTVEGEGRDQQLIFRTNLDEFVTAGSGRPLRVETAENGEPTPYILVRDRLEAKIVRPVFYELAELGTEEKIEGTAQFGVWSKGTFFRLGEPGPDWD